MSFYRIHALSMWLSHMTFYKLALFWLQTPPPRLILLNLLTVVKVIDMATKGTV